MSHPPFDRVYIEFFQQDFDKLVLKSLGFGCPKEYGMADCEVRFNRDGILSEGNTNGQWVPPKYIREGKTMCRVLACEKHANSRCKAMRQ